MFFSWQCSSENTKMLPAGKKKRKTKKGRGLTSSLNKRSNKNQNPSEKSTSPE